MSKNKLILIIGILLAVMPFIGLPSSSKTIFYFCAGIVLVVMAIVAHARRRANVEVTHGQIVTEVFVETNGPSR